VTWEQRYQDFCKKQILIAENLHDRDVLAIWDKLWRLILRDLPHPDPPRKVSNQAIDGLPMGQQVESMMLVRTVL
jgi:hypothetical protein